MRKVLVLRGGALGDFIVTLPALGALRRHWPDARVELAGNATAAQLALTRGLLDAVHSQHEARWSALYGTAPLPADFAAFLATFDLVLNFWPDPDGEFAARFPLHAAQTFLTAPAMPALAPAAAHYAAPLRALGIATSDHLFRLDPPTRSNSAACTPTAAPLPPRHGITIHPGSGSPKKNWSAENWRALLPHLPPPVTVIIGEAEHATWHDFSSPRVAVLRSPPLEALVAHLTQTRLFLGHDSGISHLAAACGAPSLLLFGPTDPAMWAPPAPHVRVVHRPNLSSFTVPELLAAIQGSPVPP